MADVVPSEELRSFMHRFYAAWQAWDFDTMKDMISAKPQLLIIGTDPDEWWTANDALDIWMLQGKEMGGRTLNINEAKPRESRREPRREFNRSRW